MPERYIGELRILQRINQYEFAFVADILRTGPVQGGRWEFANLEQHYKTFAGRPVLIAYIGDQVGDGHNAAEKIDPKTGERYRSFMGSTAERIIGTISEDEADLSLYERDGYLWLRVEGRIWAHYAPEAVETIIRTGRMDVSIEADVYSMLEVDGREVYDDWIGLGLTILGAGVDPAVPGATIRALADMQEEFESMKLRVASLVKEGEKPHNNTKTKGVKNRMYLSKQQLKELQKKFGAEYAVCCAKQTADGVMVLLMRRSNHVFCTYLVGDKDSAVDEGRITECAAQIVVELAEDDTLCADAAECVETETSEINERVCSLTADVARLTSELETSRNTVNAMQTAENKRRLSAAKEAAKRTLAKFNAAREEGVIGEALLSAVNADIDAGMYANEVNADGDWTGENAVSQRVYALCAQEQIKLDQVAFKRRNGTHILEKLGNGPVDDGTVQGLLARKGIN